MDLSHIKMLEYEEILGPYVTPMVAIFNADKLSPDEAFAKVRAGEYDPNILTMPKRQWTALFKNGKE